MLIRRPLRIALAALASAVTVASAAAADFTVLTSGQPSGTMAVSQTGQERRITYRFNDRGRGPDLHSSVELDDAGRPRRMLIDGLNYYKIPVAERFERSRDTATWRAANDAGTSRASDFYLAHERTPEHLAILARALLKSPDHELPLLPGGRAHLTHRMDRSLDVEGKAVVARLYLLEGLGFAPTPLWLDQEGELLLQGNDWFSTVRVGLEPQARTLVALQRETLRTDAKARALDLLRRPTTPIAFTNVTLFDAVTRTRRPDMTVLVQGERVAAVTPAASAAIPDGAVRVDGRGKTLLPGFWDMHVHLSDDIQGLMHVAAGVTSARDLANNADELAERRRLFDENQLIGPRIVASGFIDGPGPLAGPIKVLASTPDEIRAAIDDYAQRGYTGIKLYSSLDPKLVPLAVAEAHKRGLRVSGHVPARMTLRDVVAAGFDEVHHLNFVALNFMGPEINAVTNGITRVTALAEHGWELDPGSAEVRALVAELRARGTVIDPTVSIFEDDLLGRPGQMNPGLVAVAHRLPPVVRRAELGGGLAKNEAEAARNAKSFQVVLGLLKALYDGGVTLVAGTDERSGFLFHRELELYEQAGIPRNDILYIATLGAARVAGRDKDLGSVEVGKLADLVLVDGDPTAQISDIRKAVLVMKGGTPIDVARLYGEVSVNP